MKQQLRKLKGTTIGTSIGQIVLKQCTRVQQSEYDQIYFTCNQEFLLCKVYNITNQTSIQRYEHEKEIYEMEIYPNLARCINKTEMNFRKINYAVFVLDQLPKNASIAEIGNSLSTNQLLLLTKTVLQLIKQLKNRNQVYLNLRPENIYLNSQRNFVIINPQYICQKGSHSTLQDTNELFFSNVQKYFKYNSPQVLDNYTYFNIDAKSDCFSLACILYEIIYGKYPFQSKFANINIIYEIQEGFFGKFIGKIFKPYKERAEVEELLKMVDEEMRKNPTEPKMVNTSSTSQSNKSTKNVHSFFDDISSVFNKYTKQTQGAYINFTQDNESFPQAKHLGAILNKLYKNPNKVQKLQSIMSKHIKATEYKSRKNFIIKNLVLVLLVLRKNRNYMIHRWRDNINEIKSIVGEKSQCAQFCQLLLKKITLQQQLNCILRGNFYLQDLCQFSLLTTQHITSMLKYLQSIIIFATNLLMYKQDDYLFHYVLEVVCDQMYDLISMIIFIMIAIMKDSQLGLRKDVNMGELAPIEKVLNVVLKKINNLSNKVSSHPIYSIEPDYYNYKEDIYLKQQPQYTSFQYFVKQCNYYKGLALPQTNNFSSINDSDPKGQFGSFDNNNDNKTNKPSLTKGTSNKFYGNEFSSDQDQGSSSKKYIGVKEILQATLNNANDQNPIQKDLKLSSKSSIGNDTFGFYNNNQSNQPLSVSSTNKPVNNNINNLFGNDFFNKPSENLKKTKSSQKPFIIFPQQTNKPEPNKNSSPKMGFDDFTNFFNDNNTNKKPQNNMNNLLQKKDSINTKSVEAKQNKSGDQKKSDIFQNFSFFHQESNKKKAAVNQENKKQDLSNWMDFNQPSKKITQSQKQQKQGLKIDPKILKQDIFNYEWLKKSQQNPFGIFVQPKENKPPLPQKPQPQKLSPFVTEIISSLKLKELKDLILQNKQVVIEFDKLIFDKVIGSGSAGEVYLGKYQNQAVAIKKVKIKQNPNALKEFERQLVTYIKIKKNPCLVSLIGLSKSGQDFYLLTEFCSGGSLFDLLHKKAGQIFLNWKTKMSLILQIAKGMKALHDMRPPIIHRDLKSLNVFVAQQNNQWIAKVADFGLSRSPQAQMMTMALGTLHWMAPELLDNKQYSLKVDVYSFAVVMWEICARKTPYYELSNPMAIMKYVTIDKKRPNMTIIDINCPPKLLQLIQKCWDEDPNKRPLFKEIIDLLAQIDSTMASQ